MVGRGGIQHRLQIGIASLVPVFYCFTSMAPLRMCWRPIRTTSPRRCAVFSHESAPRLPRCQINGWRHRVLTKQSDSSAIMAPVCSSGTVSLTDPCSVSFSDGASMIARDSAASKVATTPGVPR